MPKAKPRSDYVDACETMRGEIRQAIAETAHITGLRHNWVSEALVEKIFAMLHDDATVWALREIIDRKR